ncbi:glycosyltransferase family 15 protein [Mycena epipterygia]|nr:glycosyltransferase family 15 protein [Mycena epipterygia]
MLRKRHLYLVLVAIALVVLYYFVVVPSESALERPLDFENESAQPKVWHDPPYKTPVPEKYYLTQNSTQRASAVIVILARNSNLLGVVSSITQLEARFNRKFGYPYVFLNEEPFTEEFKRGIAAVTVAPVQFGLIPPEYWYQPSWINEEKASITREKMKGLPYGGSVPYRNMCRFQSGFFFRHELLKPFKYYWRVEPDVQFFCDIDFDPFLFMQGEDKKYAFIITLPEYRKTIRSLWPTVNEFMKANPELIVADNAMDMLYDAKGNYNLCHFWSNFEIADLDLWRSEAYMKFFENLDSTGGFYYQRWGDAPVHTFGAALFARKDQIHFFQEIGYKHMPFQNCPGGSAHTRGSCDCDAGRNFGQGSFCLR